MSIYKNILATIDFGDNSAKVLQHAATLAQQFNANLIIMHVVDYAPSPDIDNVIAPVDETANKLMSSAKNQLNELLEGATLSNGSRTVVVTGHPKIEIVRVAENENADLIVIGAHGKLGLVGLLLGSTVDRVLGQASCNVLVVH